jgi:hypothetical protein
MTSSERAGEDLRRQARRLVADGYERTSVVDATRAEELVELYEELGHEVVVLPGAIVPEDQECDGCLDEPDLVTLFVRKH